MNEDGSIIRQRMIDQQYHGDIVAYNRAMDKKRQQTFSWNDIYTSSVMLPEYEELALRYIEHQLGEVPRQLTLADEPFIREAVQRYEYDHGDFDRFCDECKPHIERIYLRSINSC